jgi:tyrosinase
MHWIAVVLLSLILTTANSAPTNAPTATLSERQSSGDDLVTGIDWRDENGESAPTIAGDQWSDNEVGDVPLRREIRDLKDNHPDQWNLYILALSAMQMVDQGDDSSFYAVAGECRRSPAI